jgi:transcriptional regulator of acetoin/glycerol metabolism
MEHTRTLHVATGDRPIAVVVRVLGASAAPASFRLSDGTCTVGAQRGMDIVIESNSVSRKHLSLTLVPEGIRVEDLASRNGTFYLGQRIERAILLPGARITAGDVELALEVDSGELVGLEPHPDGSYGELVGDSVAMRRVFARLSRLEGTLVPVLVAGESGVGKELVARALHAGSKLRSGPFVAINCGALPRELVASELFGHVAGAFTGAKAARGGAFESARDGTLFLDEVAELPLEVQPMLLRALEAGEIRPVGSDSPRTVRVRVVAASNRVLDEEVKAGRFREDLFYRLAVVTLTVPPLRERREDVAPLAQRFAEKLGTTLPAPVLEHLKARGY